MSGSDLASGAAVVTGAARGLGRAIAAAAAARGLDLVLADIDAATLAETASSLRATGANVLAVVTDVAEAAALDRLADAAFSRFGSVKLLVNNAGVEALGSAWELSAAQLEQVAKINFLGPAQAVRAFAPRLVAAQQPAFILNIASIGALTTSPGQSAYLASKHALLAFSEGLFLEMQAQAPMIRVAVALPGPIATEGFRRAIVGSNPDAYEIQQAFLDRAISLYGMAPDAAAATILEQTEAGRFWITTHPEMLAETADRRARYLSTRHDPEQPEHAHILLGR